MKAIGFVLLSLVLAGSLSGCTNQPGAKSKAQAERDAYASTQLAPEYFWLNNYGL